MARARGFAGITRQVMQAARGFRGMSPTIAPPPLPETPPPFPENRVQTPEHQVRLVKEFGLKERTVAPVVEPTIQPVALVADLSTRQETESPIIAYTIFFDVTGDATHNAGAGISLLPGDLGTLQVDQIMLPSLVAAVTMRVGYRSVAALTAAGWSNSIGIDQPLDQRRNPSFLSSSVPPVQRWAQSTIEAVPTNTPIYQCRGGPAITNVIRPHKPIIVTEATALTVEAGAVALQIVATFIGTYIPAKV